MPRGLPADDTELVRLAASCDEDAFCEVIRRFNRHIVSVLRRYASHATDREDLHSEIVEKLLANRKRALRVWEPRASFGSYVATIAARHCIDWLSRRGRLPCVCLPNGSDGSSDDLLAEVAPAGSEWQPHFCMEVCERRESLRDAMASLSSNDRLVLYLRFEQDLSGAEIGRLLNISHVAARQRLFRAIGRLEDQVRRTCPELTPPGSASGRESL